MNQPSEVKKMSVKLPKSFRLFDFNIYDESESVSNDTSGSETSSHLQGEKSDDARFIVQMFGINESGETCSIFVDDFTPFFYVRVGDDWTRNDAVALLADIKAKLRSQYFANSILNVELCDYHKLYGFTGGKLHRFVKFTFKNTIVMNKVKNLWFEYSKQTETRRRVAYIFHKTNIELYESNIPPLLRYFHIHNVSPSGWVQIPPIVQKPKMKTTSCKYEYICSCKTLKAMNDKESRVPYKICSFDIEASSSHGDFPLPKKDYKRLAMNIVDGITDQLNVQELTEHMVNGYISNSILAAFGFCKMQEIDLVYPKNKVSSKESLKKRIDLILTTSLNDMKKVKTEENAEDLLKISDMFQSIREQMTGVTDAGFAQDDDSDDECGEEQKTPAYLLKKNISTKPVNKTLKLAGLLLDEDDQYSRDEKVSKLNEMLTRVMPRLEGDKVTFIGSTFMRYGEPEPYMNHCLVLDTCDAVDGAVIESVTTEKELLLKWTDLIQRENPDIIIGYNIFGFDYSFMYYRAEELQCLNEFLRLSRKQHEVCANKDKLGNITGIENTKIQLASGEYDLKYPKITGRLQIDMYAYLRRDFNLSSYKLDDVAGLYISDDVKKIVCSEHPTYGQVTELWSSNLTGLHPGDFIHIELSSFTSDYYAGGKKFKVLAINSGVEVTEMVKGKEVKNTYNVILIKGHENIAGAKNIKWGMAKDDVTPQDIFNLAKGSSSDRAIVAKYCIQDCNLVHHLMNKIDVLTGYVEMSRICSVPINYLVFRGQGIKLTSYVAKKCREKNTLMPDLEKVGEGDGYEGAIVLPPKCSMYMDNPVACVDYSSLYPSSMISQNYSHDSKVWTKEYNLHGKLINETGEKNEAGEFIYDNLPGYQYIDIDFDTYKYLRDPLKPGSKAVKTKVGKMVCRWAQFPDNKKGIMPSILEELLKARSDTRKMAKTEKDPFMQNILDKRQLGYKVTANSLYGQCGARTSTFYEKDVAASTTATGRMMITYARRIIEEVYGDREYDTECHGPVLTKAEYVYGDSVASYTPVYVRINNSDKITVCSIEELSTIAGGGWIPCIEKGKETKEVCFLTNVETWSDVGWTKLNRIIRHKLASHKKMYRILTKSSFIDVTDDHSLLLSDGTEISPKDLTIGDRLLHNTVAYNNQSMWIDMSGNQGINYYNYLKYNLKESISIRITENNQPLIAKLFLIAFEYGANVWLDYDSGYCYLKMSKNPECIPIDNANMVTHIIEIPYDGMVYDFTTENHHFAAGIGNAIVHNTDSVFFTFNLQDPKTGEKIRGQKALEVTIEIAQDAAHLCSQWLKPPMDLSYEKTLMPFILLSKKRYVGMLYETDPHKGKMKYMGLSLKRRDSCDYLKDTYGGILTILMNENNVQKSIEFLDQSLQNLIEGKVPMDKLAITKALRSDYKNPNQIAHKVLADRIGQRDPGNKPRSGDRMKFVYIVNDSAKLQGDKIETPEFIVQNKLKIDYTFYITNQLMKPLQQLFGLALESIWEYQCKPKAISEFKKEMAILLKQYPEIEVFMKKKEKICSAKIKGLLFDKFLKKIYNDKNNIREITSFFSRK